MPILELEGIRRAYVRGEDVLRGVTLRMEAGEVVGLLGRNGAGKTTLLRVAMAMLHADAGSVRLFGLDPWEKPVEVKRRVGYVSEEQALPGHLTAASILELHRELFPTWDSAFAQDLLEKLKLSPVARPPNMSKGEARKLALLCAVAHRPELLVLDEPAGGLDPAARRGFLETAIDLLNRAGSTILFSSHYMEDVERIAGRVVLLHDGAVAIDRPLDELRERFTLAIFETAPENEPARLLAQPGCIRVRARERAVHAVFEGTPDDVKAQLGDGAVCAPLSLEDFFVEMVEGQG